MRDGWVVYRLRTSVESDKPPNILKFAACLSLSIRLKQLFRLRLPVEPAINSNKTMSKSDINLVPLKK